MPFIMHKMSTSVSNVLKGNTKLSILEYRPILSINYHSNNCLYSCIYLTCIFYIETMMTTINFLIEFLQLQHHRNFGVMCELDLVFWLLTLRLHDHHLILL